MSSKLSVGYAQTVEFLALDSIYSEDGRYTVQVDQFKNRYYDIFGISDNKAFEINGREYPHPSEFKSHVVIIGEDGQLVDQLDRAAGNNCHIGEEYWLCFTSFRDDTLYVAGNFYPNYAADSIGVNTVVRKMDLEDINVYQDGHWMNRSLGYYYIEDSDIRGQDVVVVGEYESPSTDSMMIDSLNVFNYNYVEAFVGRLDADLNLEWIIPYIGLSYEHPTDVMLLEDGSTLFMGRSMSSTVFARNDTLWGQGADMFTYISHIDSVGNVISHKVVDNYMGRVAGTGFDQFSDGRVVVGLNCDDCDRVGMDEIVIFPDAPSGESVLFVLDSTIQAEEVIRVSGSIGSRWLRAPVIDVDDQIWITGYTYTDSVHLGGKSITRTDGAPIFFLAMLDAELNTQIFQEIPHFPLSLVKSTEGASIYLNMRIDQENEVLVELQLQPSSMSTSPVDAPADYVFCPSVVEGIGQVRLCSSQGRVTDFHDGTQVQLMTMDGRLMRRPEISSDGYIQIQDLPAGMYILQVLIQDERTVSGRIVVK